MKLQASTRLIAIFGHPVAHSLSPVMHNPAFERLGLDLAYAAFDVAPERLGAAVEGLRALDFLGANITIPHKSAVLPFLDEVSDLSRVVGAVNTIVNRGGKLHGTTTDGTGFLANFSEHGLSLSRKTVVLFGAGGAARTIAFSLYLQADIARLILVGRAEDHPEVLAGELREKTGRETEVCHPSDYGSLAQEAEVVVNATPLGMHPLEDQSPLPAALLFPHQVVYDIVYAPERTKLIREAEGRGLPVVGGLGMLAHQGVASFELWTGVRPDPADFHAALRKELSSR